MQKSAKNYCTTVWWKSGYNWSVHTCDLLKLVDMVSADLFHFVSLWIFLCERRNCICTLYGDIRKIRVPMQRFSAKLHIDNLLLFRLDYSACNQQCQDRDAES